MPLDDRLEAQRRHELWGQLCLIVDHLYELVDEVHELTLKWFDNDSALVDAHHDRCRIREDEPIRQTVNVPDDDIDF